jgi:hypothetical protein
VSALPAGYQTLVENGSQPATFEPLTPAQLLTQPEPIWLVEPFLREGCITELFGKFGVYKSFTAAAWAAEAPGLAVYLSAEGSPHALGAVFTAWEAAAKRQAHVLCLPQAVNMLDRGESDKLVATLRGLDERPKLVVVDTLARNIPGGNENAGEDMGRFIGLLDKIRTEFGCACLVLHHSGHEHGERGRGHSSWPGAVDVSVRMEKTAGNLEAKLTCQKMRGAAAFEPRVIRLEPIDGTLVMVDVLRGTDEAIERRVVDYVAKHPDASQNEVEKAVTGGNDAIRAAFKRLRPALSQQQKLHDASAPGAEAHPDAAPELESAQVRQVRQTTLAHPETGAPMGVRPIEGAPGRSLARPIRRLTLTSTCARSRMGVGDGRASDSRRRRPGRPPRPGPRSSEALLADG